MGADDIEVILLEDVPELGRAGKIVRVSPGYARNFLFSQGKAAQATAAARQQKKQESMQEQKAIEAKLRALQVVADALDGTELTIPAHVKEGIEIYGKITAAEIAKNLNQQAHLKLKPKQIHVDEPFTQLGSKEVEVSLSPDVSAKIHVAVIAAAPDEKE